MRGDGFLRSGWILASRALALALLLTSLAGCPPHSPNPALPVVPDCSAGTVRADVVSLDQPLVLNRIGSFIPGATIFALASDVVAPEGGATLGPGSAVLRPGKRPRPLVLRVNQGQCLDIRLTNYLDPSTNSPNLVTTRAVSLHVDGLEWRTGPADDGSWVGANPSSQVAPGDSTTYHLYAPEQGTFLLYSFVAPIGAQLPTVFPVGGQLSEGLFGALHVEPPEAEWYRSQVTKADLDLASTGEKTPDGHPILDYEARYPDDPARYGTLAGKPILRMIDSDLNLVHSDLTAVITGPHRGDFTGESSTYAPVAASPDRRQPYREFTIIYHEVTDYSTQAFQDLYSPPSGAPEEDQILSQVLVNGEDAFAINYGSAGITNEILANRFGVGPMHQCADCQFEEFFLSAWAVGDPAMVVENPTWTQQAGGHGQLHPQTTVSYPDDPSNVYHSYLWDHVKFRVLHGGASLHHLHHQHAQQWLHSPDADDGHYLDSQAIGPGSGYTLEMVYNGSGNKNLTVGDSIFHCHFYPHFAAGMWGLWRTHDVFEGGTPLVDGHATGRALPDGEILAGTPIPAVVPVPGRAMAPMPAAVRIDPQTGQIDRSIWAGGVPPTNPGFPFYIPGVAGSRAPHPPLDLAFDGGLPRHIVQLDGNQTTEQHTYQNFEKDAHVLNAKKLDERGEPAERVAMEFHAQREHPSYTPEGRAATFIANGLGPVAGAPFADPCVDIEGQPEGLQRVYKAANLQHDVVLNKEGWHFSQLRMIALWEDVVPTLDNLRPAQPFFFRANSRDCIIYMHTNLVPDYYELDDFQVRTPTDILGQHIHLVKFDVTSSDGASNGWNYEDGAFSPQAVQKRIAAINAAGGLETAGGERVELKAEPHPYFGRFPKYRQEWLGAQTEYQRWYADPLLNETGTDRTLRTVFTHDHFSPSTHQQAGLYAGLLVEPEGSTWWEPATNQQLGPRLEEPHGGPTSSGRIDGGPTSWQANIEVPDNPGQSYREFGLAFQDFQLAYQPGYGYPLGLDGTPADRTTGGTAFQFGTNYENYQAAMSPPSQFTCNGKEKQYAPCPQLISTFIPPLSVWDPGLGLTSVNYRAEPPGPRLQGSFAGSGPDPTDAANAYLSLERPYSGAAPYTTLNTQRPAVGYPGIGQQPGRGQLEPQLTAGMLPTDPYTPLLRNYMGDKVEVAVLAGAHLEVKNFTLHGARWLFEDPSENSGYRNSQTMGLSEHFEFDFTVPNSSHETVDHLYNAGAAISGVANGSWGLLRAYRDEQKDLRPLPNNRPGSNTPIPVCPDGAPLREFDVWAIDAASILPGGGEIVYSRVEQTVKGKLETLTLEGKGSLMYVLNEARYEGVDLGGDIDHSGTAPVLKSEIEAPYPLVLRAAAGDCIRVTLRNKINEAKVRAAIAELEKTGSKTGLVTAQTPINIDLKEISFEVGLHPQLVSFDVAQGDGYNAGLNPIQTAAIGETTSYTWYAGLREDRDGRGHWTPAEFGASNLMPADPLYQQPLGLGGALIIEPEAATWVADRGDRTSATVYADDGSFREFVVITWNDLMLVPSFTSPCAPYQVAVNYKSAPLPMRNVEVLTGSGICPYLDYDIADILADAAVLGADPTSPIFTARPGSPVRLRLLSPGSTSQNEIFSLDGHVWREEPYVDSSLKIGPNPLSNWFGAWAGHGASNHFDIVIESAGGSFRVPGDYLYKTMNMADFPQGMWGILRVEGPPYAPGDEAKGGPGQ